MHCWKNLLRVFAKPYRQPLLAAALFKFLPEPQGQGSLRPNCGRVPSNSTIDRFLSKIANVQLLHLFATFGKSRNKTDKSDIVDVLPQCSNTVNPNHSVCANPAINWHVTPLLHKMDARSLLNNLRFHHKSAVTRTHEMFWIRCNLSPDT